MTEREKQIEKLQNILISNGIFNNLICRQDYANPDALINDLCLETAEVVYNADYREIDDVRLMEMQLKNGEVDMKLGSEYFQTFIWSVIQTFKQNGAKNFFAIECGDDCGERYALTIQRLNGKTPIEELNNVRKQAAEDLLQELANIMNAKCDDINSDDLHNLAKKYGVEIEE